MLAWNYCIETFYVLVVLSTASSQEDKNSYLRDHFSSGKFDAPEPRHVLRNGESRDPLNPPSPVVDVIPVNNEEDPRNGESRDPVNPPSPVVDVIPVNNEEDPRNGESRDPVNPPSPVVDVIPVNNEEDPRNGESRDPVNPPSPVVDVIPVNNEEDPQQILQHPSLMRASEGQLQDFDDSLQGNQYQDQQQKQKSTNLDSVIQQVFSTNGIQGHKDTDLNDDLHLWAELPKNPIKDNPDSIKQSLPRSNPDKVIVFKDGLHRPRRNTLKRRHLLKRLRSPILRRSETNSENEQSSEELLHNILESIDQKDSDSGNPIKSAFVTKITTFNISKLLDDSKNRSFLIEKMVNYSTNLNILDSEHIPTNYSDTHSSVLQTILNLDQFSKSTDNLDHYDERGKIPNGPVSNENLLDDFVGSQLKPVVGNQENSISRMSLDKQDHPTPTEFLNGQYLQLPNEFAIDSSKQTDNENEKQGSPDFIGGQFVGMPVEKDKNVLKSKDLTKNPLDFVEGQYVEQPLDLDKKSLEPLNLDNENTSESFVGNQPEKEKRKSFEKADNKNYPIDLLANQPTELSNYDDNLKTMSYETTTNLIFEIPSLSHTNETQDRIKIKQYDKQKSLKSELQVQEKRNQVPKPKPVYFKNYKKPVKAVGVEDNIIRFTNSTDTNLRSQIGNNKEIIFEDLQETSTSTDAVTISDDLSILSESTEGIKISYPLVESGNDSLQSGETTDSLGEVIVAPKIFHENPQEGSDLENKDNFLTRLVEKNENDNGPREHSVETITGSTTIDSDLLSSESDEYAESSKALLGLKQRNNYNSILRTESATGRFIAGRENDNLSEYTTQSSSLESLESVSTLSSRFNGEVLSTHSDEESDGVVGEASNIQQNKLRSQNQLSNEDNLSQEQNITGLIEDVELYNGSATVTEPLFEKLTTQNYDYKTSNINKHLLGIESTEFSEENTTELCFPLSKKNYPTLLDLLSGNLYFERDGKKVNLELKKNPMKNCNSGTKVCKLYYDLKKSNDQSISDEMYEVPEDNKIKKRLYLKSNKNGKRHITEEYDELMGYEQNIEKNTEEGNKKLIEGSEIRKIELSDTKYVMPLTKPKPAIDKRVPDNNNAYKSAVTESPNSDEFLPVQSMFIRLPIPYNNLGTGVQNTEEVSNGNKSALHSQTNGEKITLHSLDSKQTYDDKTAENIHPYHRLGYSSGNRLARKIHQKRDSQGHTGGACGCNNPLLLSPNPIPDYKHFVGKRFSMLKNIVHTVKDWVAQDALIS